MLGLGNGELFVVFLVLLIVVGPRQLPEVANVIGKILRAFKRSFDEIKESVDQYPSSELKEEVEDYSNKENRGIDEK